jgi:hypothetical protein
VVGERNCDYPGLVFLAGRSERFEQLLEGVNQACRSHPPVILGGDDVARLVADPGRGGRFSALDHDFLDFTLESASCEGESGGIDFGGQVDQQVPLDKLITVRHVEGAARPEQVGLRGRYGDREQAPWCPALRIAPRK